jgi:hypothetical protein
MGSPSEWRKEGFQVSRRAEVGLEKRKPYLHPAAGVRAAASIPTRDIRTMQSHLVRHRADENFSDTIR